VTPSLRTMRSEPSDQGKRRPISVLWRDCGTSKVRRGGLSQPEPGGCPALSIGAGHEWGLLAGRTGYAVTFELYIRCAACFDTPSIVPISDQLRWARRADRTGD